MKKLVIGLVVAALALAVVLGVQVGQGNKLRAEIEDQRAKVAALEPVSAEAEELKKQVTALTEEKEKALQEAEAAAKAFAAEAEAAKGKVTELEQQLKAAQDEALSLSGERDALAVETEAAKGKVTELEKQLKAAQDERLALVGERDTLSVESEAAKGMVTELEKQLKDAKDQFAALTGERDALTAELAAAQKNQEDLTAQIAALNDPKIAEGQSKLEADYSALLSQVNDLTQKDQETAKKQAELETAVKTAQGEVVTLQETLKAAEAARDEALAKLAAAETAAAGMKAELEGKLAEALAAAAVTLEGQLELTLEELAKYNGKDGQPAYIAVDGIIYDVTDSRAWKNGMHNGFEAGKDLTEEIKTVSPHGIGKLEGITQVGKLKAE